MLRKSSLFILISFLCGWSFAQPKLVVGIVVDQMTNDYIHRYWNDYGDGGFKRLVNWGTYMPNTFYNYMPTATGPGHASIYAGSTPAHHGISGNRWYNRESDDIMYCVQDDAASGVGAEGSAGKRSPKNLVGGNVSDMLKMSNALSKVVSISIKDRSAILPGGHQPDMAFWWDGKSGKWMTSDYYMDKTPKWLDAFENEHPVESYLKDWTSEVGDQYDKDHDQYEAGIGKEGQVEFPYNLKKIAEKSGYGVLKQTPFGNEMTFDLASATLKAMDLGTDEHTDLVALSFSSTDYVGHAYGPYSEEVHDTYVKFDEQLTKFLKLLDETCNGEYVVFLTSDHGVMPNVEYLNSKNLASERIQVSGFIDDLKKYAAQKFNHDSIISAVIPFQIYLDHAYMKSKGLPLDLVQKGLVEYLQDRPEIRAAISSRDLRKKEFNKFPQDQIQNGYYHGRSGDILMALQPYGDEAEHKKGAGHGSPYVYDRQVPLIWYGKGIAEGKTVYSNVEITQIAPTVCDQIKIPRPPMCVDESLMEKLQK